MIDAETKVKIGDLVRHKQHDWRGNGMQTRILGIVTNTEPAPHCDSPTIHCRVTWHNGRSGGWWKAESLELVNENR
tara:strand:- start:1272 stop:1499 length:228 start_codon:yes stop_codon:yes gene_type:complete